MNLGCLRFICCTFNDVVPHHTNMVVTVTACLLMVEAQSMKQLMLDGFVVEASSTAQGHNLLTSTTANIGIAPGMQRGSEHIYTG